MSNQLQRKLLELAGDSATITRSHASEWNSTTFEGQRLNLTLQFANREHALNFMDSVEVQGENLIPLMGHTLCELKVAGTDDTGTHLSVCLAALTLKD